MSKLTEYPALIKALKDEIKNAQVKASLAVNKELVSLYWRVGNMILEKKEKEGWGAKVLETISKDLRKEFPEIKGFSRTNLVYMTLFAKNYGSAEIGYQAGNQLAELALQLPWRHNIELMRMVKVPQERLWYMQKCKEHGWSRFVLSAQIKTGLYEREGSAVTNFKETLPAPQSELAQESLKDPYVFDFLTLAEDYKERDIELQLIDHIQKFLLELGAGFAFVGRQVHLEVAEDDFYIDLLFYHLKLRCYVVIELKRGKFKPEYAGKLNFYLSVANDKLRHPDDNPTIGMLLCENKKGVVAEYAFKDINKPIGISEYELTKSLPTNLKGSLPEISEIESELEKKEGNS